MQLNMSFFINFFKGLFSSNHEEKTPEVKPAAIKRTLPSTPINPMLDEVENSNTVTHDLIHEIEKNKNIQEDVTTENKDQAKTESKAEIKVAVEPPETETKVAVEPPAKVEMETETKVAEEPEPAVKTEVKAKVPAKAKPVAKTETKAKAPAKAKPAVKTETKAKAPAKAKPAAKASINTIPKVIVLDEDASSLTIKNKRIVGHSNKKSASFIVTHIVKSDQDKLRLNLTLADWTNVDGLSFVTYDIANDVLVFSKKCDDKVAVKLNDVLLAWARELHKNYY